MSDPEVTLRSTENSALDSVVASSSSQRQRLVWPDVAKGLSILGVCFLHATLAVPNGNEGVFRFLNDIGGPLRMPLFFLVSGLFSLKLRNQTFSQLWSGRLKFLLIPYFIWAPIEIFSHQLAVEEINLAGLAYGVVTGLCTLWFLHVLAIFAFAVWLTRRCSHPIALAISFLPWVFLLFDPPNGAIVHIIVYMPVFFIGVFLRSQIQHLAHIGRRWDIWLLAIVGYVVGMVAYARVPELYQWAENIPGFFMNPHNFNTLIGTLRGLITIPLAVLLATALSHIRYIREALQWIGQRTLVIYIGHATAISLLFTLPLQRYGFAEQIATGPWGIIAILVTYCLAVCMVAGWFWSVLKHVPLLGWTIVPAPLSRRVLK